MNTKLTIEMAPFSVASGVSEKDLLSASERLEREFLSKADGYIGRVLVHRDAGTWADIVFWESEIHASKAMAAVESSAACRSYFECMKEEDHDNPQSGVSLFQAIMTYGALDF